jgi:hypothetical protein
MQAVYGNKYADVNTVRCWVWQFKKWGKQGWMIKEGQGGQDGIQKRKKCWQKSGRDYVEEWLCTVLNKG